MGPAFRCYAGAGLSTRLHRGIRYNQAYQQAAYFHRKCTASNSLNYLYFKHCSMCYFNAQKLPADKKIIIQQQTIDLTPLQAPDRQLSVGFDYAPNLVLQANNDNGLKAGLMEWGFIPHYIPNRTALFDFRQGSKNPATGKFQPPIITLNAIGEEVLEKPTFKKAALEKRCLVYSSGFYEWQHVYPLNKRTGQPLKTANKIPHFIHLKEQPYFFMAGIWSNWTDQQTGEMVQSFAILTTAANALMETIHNTKKRMPVILPEALAVEWTNSSISAERIAALARYQFAAEAMTAYPIAKDFTSSSNPQAPAQVGLFG